MSNPKRINVRATIVGKEKGIKNIIMKKTDPSAFIRLFINSILEITIVVTINRTTQNKLVASILKNRNADYL